MVEKCLKRKESLEPSVDKLDVNFLNKVFQADPDIELFAKLLYIFYLEAIEFLKNKVDNEKTRKSFEELSESQKFINRYMACRIREIINQYYG